MQDKCTANHDWEAGREVRPGPPELGQFKPRDIQQRRVTLKAWRTLPRYLHFRAGYRPIDKHRTLFHSTNISGLGGSSIHRTFSARRFWTFSWASQLPSSPGSGGPGRAAPISNLEQRYLQNQIQVAEFMPEITSLDGFIIRRVNRGWRDERGQHVEMACFRFV
jgi:hypothetical protein